MSGTFSADTTTMKARSKQAGFTLIEVMIVVGIVALLAALAIPSFQKARANASRSSCIANLKTLENAKTQWAMETRQPQTSIPGDGDLFGNTSYIRVKPDCPAGGTYDMRMVSEYTRCSERVTAGHTAFE